jgi:hypothetical protein
MRLRKKLKLQTDTLPSTLDSVTTHELCTHSGMSGWTASVGSKQQTRLFTARKRGQAKHTFSKLKVFWDKVGEMVRAGWMAEAGINKMYRVHGEEGQPVSKILKAMLTD